MPKSIDDCIDDLNDQFDEFFEKNHDVWTGTTRRVNYLLIYDYEKVKFGLSCPFVGSTIPNPANWHPNRPKIIVNWLPAPDEPWEDYSDEEIEYYQNNPGDLLLDFPGTRDENVKFVREFLERECKNPKFKEKFGRACACKDL